MVNGDNQWLVKKTTPPPPSPQKRTTLRPEVIKKWDKRKTAKTKKKFRSATLNKYFTAYTTSSGTNDDNIYHHQI